MLFRSVDFDGGPALVLVSREVGEGARGLLCHASGPLRVPVAELADLGSGEATLRVLRVARAPLDAPRTAAGATEPAEVLFITRDSAEITLPSAPSGAPARDIEDPDPMKRTP